MRIRPFFWFLLALSCTSVLAFALLRPSYAPAILQVRMNSQQIAVGTATLTLHLSDPQGLPIEQAQISSDIHMTNMVMPTPFSSITAQGKGNYALRVQFSMAGPWAIDVRAYADGFTPLEHILHIEVQDPPPPTGTPSPS